MKPRPMDFSGDDRGIPNQPTTFFMIAIHRFHPDFHESTPMVWCGYSGQHRSHIWKKGREGLVEGIRFARQIDAFNAGVSGPNYQEVDCNKLPDRGVMILQCTDDGREDDGK